MSVPTPDDRATGPQEVCAEQERREQQCRELEGDLGWGLGVVFRAYAKGAADVLADVPGGPRAFQVLAAADGTRHGTQLAVARRLGIDRTVMTYLLDDLERAGLVRRVADPNDRRARRITVTPAGHRLLDDLAARLSTLEDHLLDGLDEADRGALRRSLRQIAVRLDADDPVVDRCTLAQGLVE